VQPTIYTRYFDTPRSLVSHRLIILRSRFSFRTIDVSIEIIFFCAVSAKLRCKFQVCVGRNDFLFRLFIFPRFTFLISCTCVGLSEAAVSGYCRTILSDVLAFCKRRAAFNSTRSSSSGAILSVRFYDTARLSETLDRADLVLFHLRQGGRGRKNSLALFLGIVKMRNNASEAARAGHSDPVIIQSRQDSESDAEYIPLPNSLEDSFVRAKSHRKRRSFKSKILSLYVVIIKAVTNLEHRAGSVARTYPLGGRTQGHRD